MRLGVLDIGSNTGHLLVVDAHGGAAPLPAYSYKEHLRLAESIDENDAVTPDGADRLAAFVGTALEVAEAKGCEEVLGFATSAVRDAVNTDDVLAHVQRRTGVALDVVEGEDEARLTFLAVRRWFGWSSGRLAVFDIGGGSLEIAAGVDEAPEIAWSLPLGAGRLTRRWFPEDRPREEAELRDVHRVVRTAVARDAGGLLRHGTPDHAVATSKTLRSLARICGAAPSAQGPFVRRVLPADELGRWIPKLAGMRHDQIAALPGVAANRAHQMLAGALVAEAIFDIFGLTELEVCPWALREGVILERLDRLSVRTR